MTVKALKSFTFDTMNREIIVVADCSLTDTSEVDYLTITSVPAIKNGEPRRIDMVELGSEGFKDLQEALNTLNPPSGVVVKLPKSDIDIMALIKKAYDTIVGLSTQGRPPSLPDKMEAQLVSSALFRLLNELEDMENDK